MWARSFCARRPSPARQETPLHAGGLIYHWNGSGWEIPYQDPIHDDALGVGGITRARAFASGDAYSVLVGVDGTFTRLEQHPRSALS